MIQTLSVSSDARYDERSEVLLTHTLIYTVHHFAEPEKQFVHGKKGKMHRFDFSLLLWGKQCFNTIKKGNQTEVVMKDCIFNLQKKETTCSLLLLCGPMLNENVFRFVNSIYRT